AFSGAGNSARIAGTLALLGANAGYNTTNSTTTVTSTGNISNNSGTITSTASNLIFQSGSFYNLDSTTTAGSIPTAAWNSGSTVQIRGYTSNTGAPAGIAQTFSN